MVYLCAVVQGPSSKEPLELIINLPVAVIWLQYASVLGGEALVARPYIFTDVGLVPRLYTISNQIVYFVPYSQTTVIIKNLTLFI